MESQWKMMQHCNMFVVIEGRELERSTVHDTKSHNLNSKVQ